MCETDPNTEGTSSPNSQPNPQTPQNHSLPPSQPHTHPTHYPSTDSVPLWCGNDPSYPVFTFIRRVEDAVSHSSLTDSEKISFLRACMSCDTRTPAGAALEDDFYSQCNDFKAFCNQLIKEFACIDNDPCLASLTNMTNLIRSNSDTLSPRDAAGLAGRFRTELTHALTHSQWLDQDDMMPKSHFLSLLSYILYTNLLTPQAAQITSEIQFLPQTTIHDLKVSVEAKLRVRAQTSPPPPPPPPPSALPHAPSRHRVSPAPPRSSPSRHSPPTSRNTLPSHPPTQSSKPLTCYSCNTPGHHYRDCRTHPTPPYSRFPPSTSHTRSNTPWCHYHHSTNHSASECRFLRYQREQRSQNFR